MAVSPTRSAPRRPPGARMTDSDFEQCWRRRFVERGAHLEDDAGIAGWTSIVLNSRETLVRRGG